VVNEAVGAGKTIGDGNVYIEIVPDCSKAILQSIICGHIELDSMINTDG